jgi:ABC-2 type transport system permease protein
MSSLLTNYSKVFSRFFRIHLQSAMEYKKALWLQVLGMMLNNGAFVVFWAVIFAKFAGPFAANGVRFPDVMLMWALNSSSFGFAFVCFAGAAELSRYITEGRLDLYLLYPKHPLVTLAFSKSQVSAWGDLAYGFLLYFLFVPFSLPSLLSFTLFTGLSGMLFAAVLVLANSLSFWWGNSEDLAQSIFSGMITFGIYPERIFPSQVKFLLFSVLPVGFLIFLPVRIITLFNPLLLLAVAAADAAAVLLAFWAFQRGLRRYESGNLFFANK